MVDFTLKREFFLTMTSRTTAIMQSSFLQVMLVDKHYFTVLYFFSFSLAPLSISSFLFPSALSGTGKCTMALVKKVEKGEGT